MKILIVNRFFGGAQIPTGRMAEDVARVLVESGHEVCALASSGAYAGAAQARDQETKRLRDQETGDRGQEAGVGGEDGVCQEAVSPSLGSVGQCCGEAVGTEQLKNRTTEILTHRSTLRVETVAIPNWMPRALAWLWFTWQARKRIPRMDWDVCVLMTDPPLLPLLARRAARRRDKETKRPKDEELKAASDEWRVTSDECGDSKQKPNHRPTALPKHRAARRVAVWLMDLYPEALAASGRLSATNPLYRWYLERRQKALAEADLLICLGPEQAKRLETKRLKDQEPQTAVAIVPPWDDRGDIAVATEESLRNLALYAGNLGEAHCFEEILAAVPYLPGDWKIRFAVRGAKAGALLSKLRSDEWRVTGDESGSACAFAAANDSGVTQAEDLRPTDLELKTAGAAVEVTGYASEEETPGLLASARVHLITMSPGWEGIVVPSKLYGCVRTGRPVLFIGPENADTAREILGNDWGAVLPPGSSGEKVAAAILELAARPTKAPPEQRGAVEVAELIAELGR
jgi:hypothetical protein